MGGNFFLRLNEGIVVRGIIDSAEVPLESDIYFASLGDTEYAMPLLDGQGRPLYRWDGALVERSDEERYSLTERQADAIAALRAAALSATYAKWPAYKQANAALGIYSEEVKAQMVADIQAVRIDVHAREALIQTVQSIAELDAIDLTFPA